MARIKIAISPAHYGLIKQDNSIDGIWRERDANFLFSSYLARELEEAGIYTFLMGYGTYKSRKAYASMNKFNLYISVHTDGIDSDAIISYREGDEQAYKIADFLATQLRNISYPIGINVVSRKRERADRDNLSGLSVPGLIIMPFSVKKHAKLFAKIAYKMSSMWAYGLLKYYVENYSYKIKSEGV